MTKQREAFEKWVIQKYGKAANLSPATTNVGIVTNEYRQIRVQAMWEGWQAAQADKLEFARKVADAVRGAVKKSAFVVAHDENYVSFRRVDIQAIVSEMIGVTDNNNKKCKHTPSYWDGDICVDCGHSLESDERMKLLAKEMQIVADSGTEHIIAKAEQEQ